jgi:hypothetical protein
LEQAGSLVSIDASVCRVYKSLFVFTQPRPVKKVPGMDNALLLNLPVP